MSSYVRFLPKTNRRPSRDANFYYRRQRARDGTLDLAFDRIFDPDNLIGLYRQMERQGGPAPGPDGLSFKDLSAPEVAAIVRSLAKKVTEGTYRPGTSRRVPIPKGNGKGQRVLQIRDLWDRLIALALHQALTPLWERIFLENSFGFRPGRSPWGLLAQLALTATEKQCWILAQADITNAFDNVSIDAALAEHARTITDKQLLALIDAVLRGGDDTRQIGIDQGSPYSPTVLNVVLHDAHDVPFAQDVMFPFWARYADNLVYLAQDVSEGQQILAKSRSLLTQAGFTLKEEPPFDLRNGTAQILGFRLSAKDDGLKLDLGEDAWNGLRQTLLEGHEATDPPTTAREAVFGWIDAFGPAFGNAPDDTWTRVLQTAAQFGFREIALPQELKERAQLSWERWKVLLWKTRLSSEKAQTVSLPESLPQVTAPRVTSSPNG